MSDLLSAASPTTIRVRVRWRGVIVLSGPRNVVRAAEKQIKAALPITGEGLSLLGLNCEPDGTHPEAIELSARLGLPVDTPWEECLRHVDFLREPHRVLAEQLGIAPDEKLADGSIRSIPAEEIVTVAVQHRKELRELSEAVCGDRDAPQSKRMSHAERFHTRKSGR